MASVKLDASRVDAPSQDTPTAEVVAEVEHGTKRLAVMEIAGAPQSRYLARFRKATDKRPESWTRTGKLADIADALDAGLIG